VPRVRATWVITQTPKSCKCQHGRTHPSVKDTVWPKRVAVVKGNCKGSVGKSPQGGPVATGKDTLKSRLSKITTGRKERR